MINEIEDMTPTVLTAAIATVLLRKSNEEQSPYFASFWVESLPWFGYYRYLFGNGFRVYVFRDDSTFWQDLFII
ncbi:MAG: hypothetical protein CM15mP59_3740 [Flavobacteriaceae bacterium]|nr:MAG: hypothetical protein CM15mP59_3740 [Flavobacteriaceae bacterium]